MLLIVSYYIANHGINEVWKESRNTKSVFDKTASNSSLPFTKTLNVSIINNSISIIINKDLLFPPQPEENISPRKSESF